MKKGRKPYRRGGSYLTPSRRRRYSGATPDTFRVATPTTPDNYLPFCTFVPKGGRPRPRSAFATMSSRHQDGLLWPWVAQGSSFIRGAVRLRGPVVAASLRRFDCSPSLAVPTLEAAAGSRRHTVTVSVSSFDLLKGQIVDPRSIS